MSEVTFRTGHLGYRTGHMGYTFSFLQAGGVHAVESEFGYGRTPS
jgi:hypothetical protein